MPDQLTDAADMRRFSSAQRTASEKRIRALSQRFVDGDLDLAQWQDAMKTELRTAYKEQFVVGKGGDKRGIAAKEYLKLGPELKKQYRYLNRFARAIEAAAEQGKPLDFVVARSVLYAKSSQAMFWKTAIPVDLPQTPRDGQTQCKTNCRCYLTFDYERDESGVIIAVLVYWRLTPAEHCDDCKKLAREWNPKRFDVDGLSESSIEQAVNLLISQDPHHIVIESHLREILETDYAES